MRQSAAILLAMVCMLAGYAPAHALDGGWLGFNLGFGQVRGTSHYHVPFGLTFRTREMHRNFKAFAGIKFSHDAEDEHYRFNGIFMGVDRAFFLTRSETVYISGGGMFIFGEATVHDSGLIMDRSGDYVPWEGYTLGGSMIGVGPSIGLGVFPKGTGGEDVGFEVTYAFVPNFGALKADETQGLSRRDFLRTAEHHVRFSVLFPL